MIWILLFLMELQKRERIVQAACASIALISVLIIVLTGGISTAIAYVFGLTWIHWFFSVILVSSANLVIWAGILTLWASLPVMLWITRGMKIEHRIVYTYTITSLAPITVLFVIGTISDKAQLSPFL